MIKHDDPLAIAQALVATPSVNPMLEEGGGGEGAVADLTAGWLQDWGLKVDTVEVAAVKLTLARICIRSQLSRHISARWFYFDNVSAMVG